MLGPGPLGLGVDLRFGQVERGKQLACRAREADLVELRSGHLGQRGVGLGAERAAPGFEDPARRVRDRLAGHLLARQQAECGRQRQLVLARHAVEAFGLAFFLQSGPQVGGDALHMPGADHLDTRLLQRVVDVLRLAAPRAAGGVDDVVVVAQAKGDAIGRATQLGHLGGRQRPGRQW